VKFVANAGIHTRRQLPGDAFKASIGRGGAALGPAREVEGRGDETCVHRGACGTLRLVCCGLVCCGVIWAQPAPVLKSETRVVLVDAVVTGKKGEYIHDLSAKDFHIWEDNKEQKIQSFSLESAGGNPADAAARTSYLVLVFDYSAMDAGDQIRARQAAGPFIDANTGPDHVMAVATFDGGFRIVQGFTGNAGRLKDAINGDKAAGAAVNNARAGTGAATDLSGRDKFRSLEGLATELSAVPGRKTVVFLTGNLTVSSAQKSALDAAIQAFNKSNAAVYPIDVRDPSIASAFSAENGGGRTRGAITLDGGGGGGGGGRGVSATRNMRGDADPSAAADPSGASQQALFALATGTGGFVIRNAGELPGGLQKIGEEQGEYYVLGYAPPDSREGSCHALRVKVDRSGITVRARSSYCTGKGQDLVTGTATEKNLESRAASAQAGNLAASMQLPFFYVGPNIARVNLAMEISPEAVKFEHKKDVFHAEINVLGIASSSAGDGSQGEGATGARFSDTLPLDFDDAEMQKWKQRPLHYEKEFKIAPGQYKLTVVFSSGGESFGKLERPLIVEPYQPGQLALSGVAFGTEIHKAGEAGAALFEDKTPLVTGGMQLTPAGSNVFAQGGQAFCYFEVYTPDPANPGVVEVRILDGKRDEAKWDGGAVKLDRLGAGKSPISVGMNLPIASLAAGSYRLEVVATDPSGKSVKRTADFEVK
jgi:VWFA-related protein